MTRKTVFFDLDGVLADFVRAALKLHGASLLIKDVRWDFDKQIGMSATKFWAPMGRDFWSGLSAHADGMGLLAEAEKIVGEENIGILTSPCSTDGCADGKRDWVKRVIPNYSKRLFVGSAKELIAGPGKFLIDDRDENCESFHSAGGFSWLVPRPWNRLRDAADSEGNFDLAHAAPSLRLILK